MKMSNSINDIYGGNYLNAKTVISNTMVGQQYTIEKTSLETFENKGDVTQKVVMLLAGVGKGLPLNKTNASILAEKFGDDYTSWVGKRVSLTIVKRNYNGQMVDAVEVVPKA